MFLCESSPGISLLEWGFYEIRNTFLMAPQSVMCIEQFSIVQLQSGFTPEPIKILKKPYTIC